MEGCSRNKQVYEKIVVRMVEAGFERKVVQCGDKIKKKLKDEYKKIKENYNLTTKL